MTPKEQLQALKDKIATIQGGMTNLKEALNRERQKTRAAEKERDEKEKTIFELRHSLLLYRDAYEKQFAENIRYKSEQFAIKVTKK